MKSDETWVIESVEEELVDWRAVGGVGGVTVDA